MVGASADAQPGVQQVLVRRSDSRNGNTVSIEPAARSSGRTSETSSGSPVSPAQVDPLAVRGVPSR